MKKRNEIKQSIVETEEQLQALKKNLDEIRERRRKLKEAPASDPEAMEQKKKQIQNLKEIQSQTHSHNSPSGFFQLLSLYIKNRW